MKFGSLLLGMAVVAASAAQANAAFVETITFSGTGVTGVYDAMPATYQPLASHGVNITWGQWTNLLVQGWNPNAFLTDPTTIVNAPSLPAGANLDDHTQDTEHRFLDASTIRIQFDQPVYIGSMWLNNYQTTGNEVSVTGWTNSPADAAPALVTSTVLGSHPSPDNVYNAHGYSWTENTAFGQTPIKELVLLCSGTDALLDDLKVSDAPFIAPEPASLSLLGLGALALLRRRK